MIVHVAADATVACLTVELNPQRGEEQQRTISLQAGSDNWG